MTTAVDTSSSGYLRGLFGSALHVYDYAKQVSPSLLTVQLERLEGRIQPITSRIKALGEPIVSSLDARIEEMTHVPRTITDTVYTQTQLYAAVLRGWLAHGLDYERYIEAVRQRYGQSWKPALAARAQTLHAFLHDYVHIDDVTMLAAALVTEGNERLMNVMTTIWSRLQKVNLKDFQQKVREKMGDDWKEDFRTKAQLFFSLARIQAVIQRSALNLKTQSKALVRKAKDVASRTSFLLLRATDQAVNASIVLLDDHWVSRVCGLPPSNPSLRGFDRLAEMEHRLRTELSLFVAAKQEAVQGSGTYQYISDKSYRLMTFYTHVRQTDVYALTWPEQVKTRFESVFLFVGLEQVVKTFDRKIWEQLDTDEDKTVTIGDLVRTVGKVRRVHVMDVLRRLVRKYQETYAKWVRVGAVNGEHQD